MASLNEGEKMLRKHEEERKKEGSFSFHQIAGSRSSKGYKQNELEIVIQTIQYGLPNILGVCRVPVLPYVELWEDGTPGKHWRRKSILCGALGEASL